MKEIEKDIKIKQKLNLEKFESEWCDKWQYKDIVFWFKIKLGYFNNDNKNANIRDEDSKDVLRADAHSTYS